MEIDKQTKKELLKKYQSHEKKTGLKKHLLKLILKAPFIRPETSQWLFASMENYPDVLRYDEVNKRYYFSKC